MTDAACARPSASEGHARRDVRSRAVGLRDRRRRPGPLSSGCNGDSGGPLYAGRASAPVLLGVVSDGGSAPLRGPPATPCSRRSAARACSSPTRFPVWAPLSTSPGTDHGRPPARRPPDVPVIPLVPARGQGGVRVGSASAAAGAEDRQPPGGGPRSARPTAGPASLPSRLVADAAASRGFPTSRPMFAKNPPLTLRPGAANGRRGRVRDPDRIPRTESAA